MQLRHLSREPINAGAVESANRDNPADWPRFVRTTDIESLTRLRDDDSVTVPPSVAKAAPVARNDILATRAGATVGKSYIHLSDEPACYAGYLVRIRLNEARVLPMYAAYWTLSTHYLDQIAMGSIKSTIENYSASKYRATVVPLPTLSEQMRIVEKLKSQLAAIDALIAEAEGVVTVAEERRSALITAAVTGQIDVRGEVA